MKRRIVGVLACFTCAVAWGADPVISLDIKTGTWESTTTYQTTGRLPIPEEALAKLTPAQRARVEAAQAKVTSKQAPTTKVSQRCMTKEDISKPLMFDDRPGCKMTVVSSTASRFEGRVACNQQGMTMNGTMRVDVFNPESVKFSFQMTSGEGVHTMVINSSGTAKWIGAACNKKN